MYRTPRLISSDYSRQEAKRFCYGMLSIRRQARQGSWKKKERRNSHWQEPPPICLMGYVVSVTILYGGLPILFGVSAEYFFFSGV